MVLVGRVGPGLVVWVRLLETVEPHLDHCHFANCGVGLPGKVHRTPKKTGRGMGQILSQHRPPFVPVRARRQSGHVGGGHPRAWTALAWGAAAHLGSIGRTGARRHGGALSLRYSGRVDIGFDNWGSGLADRLKRHLTHIIFGGRCSAHEPAQRHGRRTLPMVRFQPIGNRCLNRTP